MSGIKFSDEYLLKCATNMCKDDDKRSLPKLFFFFHELLVTRRQLYIWDPPYKRCFTSRLLYSSWKVIIFQKQTNKQTKVGVISRTTEPILGLFVLIWMHFSCLIQIWQLKFLIFKNFEKVWKFDQTSTLDICIERIKHFCSSQKCQAQRTGLTTFGEKS